MTHIGLLLDAKASIAESLLWAPDEGALYWMDVKEPARHRLRLLGAKRGRWALPAEIGSFALLVGRRAHSQSRTVFAFPLDVRTGHLGPREVFVTTPDGRGIPDGAAVDEEGAYWCALHGGGALRRYAPGGALLREPRAGGLFNLDAGVRGLERQGVAR